MASILNRPLGSMKRLMWEMSKAHQLAGGGRGGYTLPTPCTEPNEPRTMEPGEPSEPGEPRDGAGSFGSGVLPPRGHAGEAASTDPSMAAQVDATGPATVDCRDYRAHQRRHRQVDGHWVCDTCSGESVSWM
jgi:hypothetical protein